MPTADQLRGVANYRAATADHRAAETALLEAMTQAAEAQVRIDRALKGTDAIEIAAARASLAVAATLKRHAETAREQAITSMANGRRMAVDTGAGFDLLSGRHPLLLLPVRLETRFAWLDTSGARSFSPTGGARSLLIRILPDDIHDDAHEPELTHGEIDLLARFQKRLADAREIAHLDEAWSDVIRDVGPTRAGWLGELLARGVRPGRRPGRLSRPSVSRLMPDRWTAFVELDDGSPTRTARSNPVREPLETGPSPDGMAWMIDFDAALKAGMALVVPDLPDSPIEVRRVIVVGARGTLDPDETAAELERLLDAQHYTRGCAFVAPGTPTNSLPDARAGFSSRPSLADVLPVERRRLFLGQASPLCVPGDGTDAAELAAALGIRLETFGYVTGADLKHGQNGSMVRRLLIDATRRHLTRMLSGIIDEGQLTVIFDVAIESVSATGPFPTLRVGSQPYGVLPVLLRDDAGLAPGSFAARALPVLDALRKSWAKAAANLRHVGDAGPNPGETLIRVLQRDAVARHIAFRPLLGPQLAREVVTGRGPDPTRDAQRAAAAVAIDALGAAHALGSPLLEVLHLDFAPRLTAPLVEPSDVIAASPQRASVYLELVASLRPDKLLVHDYGGGERPRSLLFAIARLALLEGADAFARAAHVNAGADPTTWDDETVATVFRDGLATPLQRLENNIPLDSRDRIASVAFRLSEQGIDAGALHSIRHDLRSLAIRPPEETEEQLRANLGLFSHRLDPWYTTLAVDRLREIRNDVASMAMVGLNIGAYGVVEHLRASPRQPVSTDPGLYTSPINGGYVHAPSAGHGAAAAVLRSVHLAHAAAGDGESFSVDLSSARVRRGLELLEGIRGGQPLAALLGYRIERDLAAEGLQQFIAPFRSAAPLVAHALTPGTEPADSVAATNVVDGLTLLEEAGYDGEKLPTLATLLASRPAVGPVTPAAAAGLERVLNAAADSLDAVADLAVAESVYQAVQGNPVRAGGTVDGLSGAPVPPPDIGVVRTPRTGVGVTHRLLVLLQARSRDASGWSVTPRALAEPRLEAWAQAALPPPERIVVRARFVDADGVEIAELTLTLGGLLMAAEEAGAPELRLGALDVVLVADPHETAQHSPLELRIEALVELKRPQVAVDATLQLVFDRLGATSKDAFELVDALEIARALRAAITHARPLLPEDLAPPGAPPPTAVDNRELDIRAADATTALDTVIATLKGLRFADSTEIRRALFVTDLFGVPGAAPVTARDTPGETPEAATQRARELQGLRAQVDAVLTELRHRKDASAKLSDGDAVGRLQTAFGNAFVVLPVLRPAAAALSAFARNVVPGGATRAIARTWLARAAPVREAVGALDAALGYADALGAVDSTAPVPALHVGQLGGAVGERWTALPPASGDVVPGGRISLVAATPGADLPTDSLAGLLVDEWVEIVPSAQETTSISFHYEAPTAAAPQVWLLGVPPAGLETWTEVDARRIVEESLELAQLRLVDAGDIPDLGQLLPTFVTAENTANETIGLDIESLTGPEV